MKLNITRPEDDDDFYDQLNNFISENKGQNINEKYKIQLLHLK
jgi:hypothetical protein